jgi:hypothetical protein
MSAANHKDFAFIFGSPRFCHLDEEPRLSTRNAYASEISKKIQIYTNFEEFLLAREEITAAKPKFESDKVGQNSNADLRRA